MAFTKMGSHVQLDKGNGSSDPYYFHPVDIEEVRKQQGATSLELTKAIIKESDGTISETSVLIGLYNHNPQGGGNRIIHQGAIIALACTPFVDQDGGEEIK